MRGGHALKVAGDRMKTEQPGRDGGHAPRGPQSMKCVRTSACSSGVKLCTQTLVAAAWLTGCGNGTLVTGVFSDDGAGVLFSEQDFKSESGCITPDSCLSDSSGLRGARLFLGTLSGDEVEIESEIEGVPDLASQAYGNLAYVRSQGYAMYTERTGAVVVHHLDGADLRIESTPGSRPEGAFPSLDGAVIALVGHDRLRTVVQFVDPNEGTVLDEFSVELRKGPVPEAGRGAVVWTEDGLGVWGGIPADPEELGAYIFNPGQMPERRDNLPCAAPTPSFAIRDGRALPDAEEGAEIVASATEASVCSQSPRFPARPGPSL